MIYILGGISILGITLIAFGIGFLVGKYDKK